MENYSEHSHTPIGSGESKDTKNDELGHNRILHFIDRMHTLQTLYLIAGVCQLVLGMAVIVCSVMGLIKPFYLSVALTGLASVSIPFGIYFCYASTGKIDNKSLLREAMRRIVEDQN